MAFQNVYRGQPHLASDAQHMARFEREGKTVAALNHMATICGQRCQAQGHDMR